MINRHSLPMFLAVGILCVFPLAACEEREEPAAAEGMAETAAPADEADASPAPSSIPVAPSPEEVAASEGSMAEDSPAGEAVTEQEIPHSDVPPPSREVFTNAECDFEAWVGTSVDEAKVKETGRPYRILTPDSMMTMDHNPERINVVHDEDMKITRVWCG